MRIACPSCATRYEIADELLAKPRTVRCSRCLREWLQDPITPPQTTPIVNHNAPPPEPPYVAGNLKPDGNAGSVAELPQPAEKPLAVSPQSVPPSAPVLPAPAVQPKRAGSSTAVMLTVFVGLLVLAALASAAHIYRAEIQAAWPPSERLFRLLPE